MSAKLRSLVFLTILYAFWLLMSGMYTPFLMSAGFGCALFVVVLTRRMGIVSIKCKAAIVWRLFIYLPWLLLEIVRSAIDVMLRILDPRLPISPTMIEFPPMQNTELGLFMHAHSITLTPGTLTIEVEPGRLLVHSLTSEGAAGLTGSEMDRRCAGLEA